MKTVLLILTALLAHIAGGEVAEDFFGQNLPTPLEQKEVLAIQGRSLSSKGQVALQNFVNKLPCGWPEAGIPPLAPYTKDQIVFELKKSFAKLFAELEHFRIDGLNNLVINKLKINYTFSQKVQFNWVLPRVVISGKFSALDAYIDVMKKYGISLKYDGHGDFELVLENITLEGQFKYTMPFIFGSIKIYKFNGAITLGNVVSQINGLVGEGKFKQLLDDQIEDILMKAVRLNQDKISAMLSEDLVPYLNGKLKDYNAWSVIGSAFGTPSICYPPVDPLG